MHDKSITKITEILNSVGGVIEQKDPSALRWDLRTTAAFRIFSVFDAPRFRLEPVDLDQVLRELREVLDFVERYPKIPEGILNKDEFHGSDGMKESDSTSFEGTDARMQYLYGLAWSQLTREQYFDAAGLFARRLRNSNIDLSFLEGAECLDLGTGIARYALAMVQLGAGRVVGVDFSKECLDEARRRLEGSEEQKKITLCQKSLYDLPSEMNDAFDFVCANGVIHHLPDPAGGLEVAYQTTKKGGRAFVFVFAGNDSPYWRSIDLVRDLVSGVPVWYTHQVLKFYNTPGSKLFNTLDGFYTPIQHHFDQDWFEDTLRSTGFKEIRFLDGGAIHDPALRCRLFETDRLLYGLSEIRYLMRK